MTTADELFHVDASGERAIFDDVLADGLDGDLDARIPALRELLESRDAYKRLSAARMLVAWDDPVGLEALIGWAREPARAPYGAVANRFTGEDTTFGHLADALGAGGHTPRAASVRAARVSAGRALLSIFEDYDFERYLAFALYDDVLRKSLVDEIAAAVERALRVLDSGDRALVRPLDADRRAARAAGEGVRRGGRGVRDAADRAGPQVLADAARAQRRDGGRHRPGDLGRARAAARIIRSRRARRGPRRDEPPPQPLNSGRARRTARSQRSRASPRPAREARRRARRTRELANRAPSGCS